MKKLSICFLFLFVLLIFNKSNAQVNLVANPSFEDTVRCPNNTASMLIPSACKNWYDPDSASSDYFNSCTSNLVGVPTNFAGWQNPRTGAAYSGFRVFPSGEYIQEKLDSVLYSNHTYCIEFYISLSNNANIATNNIGMYISDTTPPTPIPPNPFTNCTPQINDTTIISDTLGWTKVSGKYIAHGGEKYITIGNFFSDAQTDTTWVAHQNGGNLGYYYIDDVSIVDCTPGLGINELTDINTLTISPNPATNEIKITTNDNLKLGEVKIYNSIGACVLLSPPLRGVKEGLLDISSLLQGLYFIEVITHKGIQRKKFVKQ